MSAPVKVVAAVAVRGDTDLTAAVRRELTDAGRLESALGQAALELARNVGDAMNTGAAVASLVKQLRETMTDALKGAESAADALDELRARRDHKRTG